MASRSNKSDVWEHFYKPKDKKDHNATCKYCSKVLGVPGSSTTGLWAHARSKHAEVLAAPSTSQVKITAFTPVQRACSETRQDQITKLLALCIADNMLPISLVESASFRNLMAFLEPNAGRGLRGGTVCDESKCRPASEYPGPL